MPLIWAPVRPSMPSGFSRKSIVASETILLSSVIANRCSAASRSEPGGRMISDPRWAIRLVTRAKASRPLSVNSIVTMGSWVFWSTFCSGFLMSVPDSSESSSSTKKRCTDSGWLGARSASITTMPWGTLSTSLLAGGPLRKGVSWSASVPARARPGPSASSSRHSLSFGTSSAPRGGPRIDSKSTSSSSQLRGRAGDQPLVGPEEVEAVLRRVVVAVGLLERGALGLARGVGALGLRLGLRGQLDRLEERLRAGERRVGPAVAEHVGLPVVELQLARWCPPARSRGRRSARRAGRSRSGRRPRAGSRARRRRGRRCACGSSRSRRRSPRA